MIEEGVAKGKKPFRGLIIARESQKGKLYGKIFLISKRKSGCGI